MILTCIILKIKVQLKKLVNWKLWDALFYSEQSVEFWQNSHISQASQVIMRCRKKIGQKKITEANFSNLVSDLLYTYLKKSTEKLWAKSILWAKLDMRILQRLALKVLLAWTGNVYLCTICEITVLVGDPWKLNVVLEKALKKGCHILYEPCRTQSHHSKPCE